MPTVVPIAILLLIPCTWIGSVAGGNDEPPARSWRSLSLIKDGKVDESWTQVGWGGFVVDNGSLRTECNGKGMGLLLYKKERFGNSQIRVVYKCKDAKSNSGVFVRIDDGVLKWVKEKPPAIGRDKDGRLLEGALEKLKESSEKELGAWYPVHHGYEVQICDDSDEFHRTGAIYSLAKAAPLPKHGPTEGLT